MKVIKNKKRTAMADVDTASAADALARGYKPALLADDAKHLVFRADQLAFHTVSTASRIVLYSDKGKFACYRVKSTQRTKL